MHRVRGGLSHTDEGDLARGGRGAGPAGEDGDGEAAARRSGTLYRLRYLRGQVPGTRKAGDLCFERGGEQVEGKPVAADLK